MALTPWRLGSCRLHFVPAPGEAESQRRGMTAISLADGDSGAAPRSGFSLGWSPSAASQVGGAWQPRQNRRCLLVSWLGRAGHRWWCAAPSCHGETVTASVQRRQGKRMRNYEMMVILDPALEERTVQPSLEQFLNVVTTAGGTVDKVDVWGRRRLAYEIDKKSEGIYTVIDMTAEPDTVKELDRQLNLNEAVLRTKIVRPDHR